MSTIEIDGGRDNPFEFTLNIKGASEGIKEARLSLIGKGRIVSFPCAVKIEEAGTTRLKASVNGVTPEFDQYRLEVFIAERHFVPLEGTVIVKENVSVESVSAPMAPRIEIEASRPVSRQPVSPPEPPPVVEETPAFMPRPPTRVIPERPLAPITPPRPRVSGHQPYGEGPTIKCEPGPSLTYERKGGPEPSRMGNYSYADALIDLAMNEENE